MEMREMMDKILEMREMRETFKNAGDILEMRESPAQCGRVDSYAGGVLGLPDDGYVPPDFWRSSKKTEKNGPLEGLKWRKIRIFVNFMTLIGTFFLEI